jgi:hypothetical protein
MIKTAIKHFIYDYCIETVFRAIAKNFATISDDNVHALYEYIPTYVMEVYNKANSAMHRFAEGEIEITDGGIFHDLYHELDNYVYQYAMGGPRVDWGSSVVKNLIHSIHNELVFIDAINK